MAAFAKFGKFENPVDVVSAAVAGRNPVSDLTGLAKLAKRGGQSAVDGLRASVWDDAIRRGADASGNVSAQRVYDSMFRPLGPNQPSIIKLMESQAVITPRDVARLESLFKEFQKIEKVAASGKSLESLIGDVDPMFDLAVRVAGAKIGSTMHGGGAGALVAAARGSTFARNIFEKVPNVKTRDLLIQAATDPAFAAMLLEKPRTASEGIKLSRQIHAYLIQAGLTAFEGDAE
jgi:hypothetical protein